MVPCCQHHTILTSLFFYSWEYPNQAGIGTNTISPNDSANFLLFLQLLQTIPVLLKTTLSASVPIAPFAGPTGTPLTDVSGFAAVLDYIGE
jgi:chitinase